MNATPPRILILQPKADDGPSYLATWLHLCGVAFVLCNVEAGDRVPLDAGAFDAIAMLGGSMSANDDLPFLQRIDALLRDAVARDVPVLGHCLGGQMLARALGAAVSDNPVAEIGWSEITRQEHPLARAWLGDAVELAACQWHFQTFALPAGATLIASNAACAHQAFAIGPHLGMQFHIEVDAEKLDRWCREVPPPDSPLAAQAGVQDEATMRADSARLLAQSQQVAARIYRRWLALASERRDCPGRLRRDPHAKAVA
jgi:GMP synthase (glutamine-hydrolysing)